MERRTESQPSFLPDNEPEAQGEERDYGADPTALSSAEITEAKKRAGGVNKLFFELLRNMQEKRKKKLQ